MSGLGEIIPADRSVLDLTDGPAIRRFMQAARPNIVINAAGYTAVDRAETEPELAEAVNAKAPGILAEEARQLGAAIVHYSTDYIFDGAKGTPYQPNDEPNPLNVYGRTKLAGERAILASGASHLILRTSWVFSMRRCNFLLTMLNLARRQSELRVVNDQFGCPTWSRLIAQGTAQIFSSAIERGGDAVTFGARAGIYHLACSGIATWFELAQHIIRAAAIEPVPVMTAIGTDDYPTAAARPACSVLDCATTESTFGVKLGSWQPAVIAALSDAAETSGMTPAVVGEMNES